MATNIALLTGSQKSFVDNFSQLIIRESSDFCSTSSDAELSDPQREDMSLGRNMALSKDLVDKRLINLYKIRRDETIEGMAAEAQ